MRSFFKGWRRKVGCLLLLLACVVMAFWMRSRITKDFWTIRTDKKTLDRLSNSSQGFKWERLRALKAPDFAASARTEWKSLPVQAFNSSPFDTIVGIYSVQTIRSQWQCCGFQLLTGHYGEATFVEHGLLVIPHWPVVLLLSLLSAWLIFFRARKKSASTANPHLDADVAGASRT
jgi:hypothetical protein